MNVRLFLVLLVSLFPFHLNAQPSRKIPFNGLLTDLCGQPIKRARVYVTNPKDYALTNKDGEFGLTNVAPYDTLNIIIKKKQLFKVPINGKRSIVIRLSDSKLETEEDEGRITSVFLKGAFHINDISGLYNLRDAVNMAINKVESGSLEDEDWD